ncbi:MAG: gliding motility-associated C-terminal domain-containing protein [Bacteroidales bacterium]|nr:gliding motility-associated C-terminal domain-containing protein [Bacteroidales bacterium]
MLRNALLIIVLIVLSVSGRGQIAGHYMHCLVVLDNGDVSMAWEKPVDEDTFVRYFVVRSTASNPTAFDTIKEYTFYGDTSYVDTLATANTQQNFYYIITDQSGALPDIYSDTLSTIHLRVDNSDNHLAVLDWNSVHDPLPAGSDLLYRIMLLNADSIYEPIDSIPGLHYEYPVLVCRADLRFRIEIGNANGCTSVSNNYFATFADTDSPPMPALDSVSVNPYTGETILGWTESSEGDAGGYVVYHAHTTNDTLDFIVGKENTSYSDVLANPCEEPKSYAIAAFDTCGNIGPGTYDIPQRTILLNDIVFKPCEMANYISWTAYINMEPSLQGYRLYLSTGNGAFELLADLPAGTLSYEHTGLETTRQYRYFVRAYSVNHEVTSSSCIKENTTWQYLEPLANRLDNITVEGNELVAITMLPDTFAFVPQLKLYRSETASGPYGLIAEIEPQGADVLYYDDLTAEVNSQSYYYKSSLVDSCGNEVLMSQAMRTIRLTGEKTNPQMNMLNWNAFEGWPEGVENYEVFRAVDQDGGFDRIGTTEANKLDFEDDLSSLSGEFGMLRYLVRARRISQTGYFSHSNEIIIEYAPAIILPNAFAPEGTNKVFKPAGTFASFSEYRMDIYNRWGEILFTSKDFGTGWDGRHNGRIAPAGVYVCVIFYRSAKGATETLKTSFVLLR